MKRAIHIGLGLSLAAHASVAVAIAVAFASGKSGLFGESLTLSILPMPEEAVVREPVAAPPAAPTVVRPDPPVRPVAQVEPTPVASAPPPFATPRQSEPVRQRAEAPSANSEKVLARAKVAEASHDSSAGASAAVASGTQAAADSLGVLTAPQPYGAPACLVAPKPEYPAEARRKRQEGVVLIRVDVDQDGRPSRVLVAESSGVRSLDASATSAVKSWRFAPATLNHTTVCASVEIPVRFSLSDARRQR